jgi:hypothetical protein
VGLLLKMPDFSSVSVKPVALFRLFLLVTIPAPIQTRSKENHETANNGSRNRSDCKKFVNGRMIDSHTFYAALAVESGRSPYCIMRYSTISQTHSIKLTA